MAALQLTRERSTRRRPPCRKIPQNATVCICSRLFSSLNFFTSKCHVCGSGSACKREPLSTEDLRGLPDTNMSIQASWTKDSTSNKFCLSRDEDGPLRRVPFCLRRVPHVPSLPSQSHFQSCTINIYTPFPPQELTPLKMASLVPLIRVKQRPLMSPFIVQCN